MAHTDAAFTDSIPETYERHLVPMFFAPYAADIVERARAIGGHRVLEIAAGTGIVTRLLAEALPGADIEATDLNEAMVACASRRGESSAVHWSTADAMALPFEDSRFDLTVCQFGMMFFPDRRGAFGEARRVLAPGGAYLFNVWDSLEHNDVARVVSDAVGAAFPDDPPLFVRRTPHGHADPAAIERDLRAAGATILPARPLPSAASRPPRMRPSAFAKDPRSVTRFSLATPRGYRRSFSARPGRSKLLFTVTRSTVRCAPTCSARASRDGGFGLGRIAQAGRRRRYSSPRIACRTLPARSSVTIAMVENLETPDRICRTLWRGFRVLEKGAG